MLPYSNYLILWVFFAKRYLKQEGEKGATLLLFIDRAEHGLHSPLSSLEALFCLLCFTLGLLE